MLYSNPGGPALAAEYFCDGKRAGVVERSCRHARNQSYVSSLSINACFETRVGADTYGTYIFRQRGIIGQEFPPDIAMIHQTQRKQVSL